MNALEEKIYVLFDTTADAMSFENACKNHKITGRLIPVPQSIKSGCGIMWMSSLEFSDSITKLIEDESLKISETLTAQLGF